MDEALQVLKFEELPSPVDFAAHIESKNVPSVFHGCIKDWRACSSWNPRNGGLDYLQEQVGSSVVEAMLSKSPPVFYGDLRNHEMVPLPFSSFITSCKQILQNSDATYGVCAESEIHGKTGHTINEAGLASVDSPHQFYLAQVPISNMENKERSQLESLKEDIQMPTILETKALASINLWMNNARSRSSTHYDPHHNLLCIVAGCKQVVLWPPSASSLLYPMPIYGEASNHSSVDLENPDFSIHSRAKHSMEYSQKVILRAGDALFIPEGWFHQVDSDDLTIAVNFWWQSSLTSSMSEHMDAYYLRIILKRLVNRGMNQMLHGTSVGISKSGQYKSGQLATCQAGNHEHHLDGQQGNNKDSTRNDQKQKIMLHQLEPSSLQALHELVSLVHDRVSVAGQSQPMQSTLKKDSAVDMKGECKGVVTDNAFRLEDDPVANIFWILEPLKLQNVLLAMVHNFPRTLEALILHMLSPIGAEILTQKFDEMDQSNTKEYRNEFYQAFYGVFDDQFTAMDAILNGKESFALQAFRNVLNEYVGVNFDEPKP